MNTEALAAGDRALFLLEGETIGYDDNGDGFPVTRTAIVIRNPPDLIGQDEVLYGRTRYEMLLANDATLGSTTINVNKDTVELKKEIGDTSDTTFRVISKDIEPGGFWRLGLASGA